ncbi:MAG: formylglycine-generating enzyme family protein [Tepidisphaeraceae bacterium]
MKVVLTLCVTFLMASWSSAVTRADAPPAGMRAIPAGEFTMGTDDPKSMPNERPAHRVKVEPFFIDEHPVTNAAFRKFVEASGYVTTAERKPDWEELKKQVPPGTPKPPEDQLQPGSLVFMPPGYQVPLDDLSQWWAWVPGANWKHPEGPKSNLDGRDEHPVVQMSWDDAVAYAKWAGKRLPTEPEWEYAARGGLDGKRYPWGDEFKLDGKFRANTYTGTFPAQDTKEDGFAGTSPVRSFPANGYGLYDMGGNVWNWSGDVYAEPSGAAPRPDEVRRVIKGGSFLCNPSYCESYRPSARRGTPFDTGSSHVGFRCAKSAVDAQQAK